MTEIQPIRVMLVDDNRAFLRVEAALVSALSGVQVVGSASTAEEALAQAEGLKPDLILIDMVMPGMSGIEAIKLVKQGADAPNVVLVTLYNDRECRASAMAAGADGFIPKDELVVTLPLLLESLFPGRPPFTLLSGS